MRYKSIFIALLALTVGTALISCDKKDDPDPNTVQYMATLNSSSEVPPNASAATGTATLTLNNTTKVFTIVVTHNIAAPTNGHIHKGAVGVSGPAVFPFASPFTSPINYTSVALTAEQLSDLNAGLYYVNIHTTTYPDGEIRGQLIKQ